MAATVSTHMRSTRGSAFGDRILDWFPVPKLLALPAIGVDISESAVRYLELLSSAAGVRLGVCGEIALGESVLQVGSIVDRAELVNVLRRVRSVIRTPYVWASLPTERAYIFEVALPSRTIGYADLRRTIEFHLEEHVPLAPRDVIIDVVAADTLAPLPGAAVVAVPAALIEEYLSVFHESGLRPLSLEVAAEAVARALASPGEAETTLMLRMGSDRTSLIFARGSVALFASTIEFGGATLTSALAHELGVEEEEAERLKRESGLIASAENKRICQALGEHMDVFTKEVARYLRYWNTHGAEAPSGEAAKTLRQGVSRVYLCGGGANLRGLAPHLSAALGFPVSLADVWASCFSLDEYIPAIPRHESLAYCAAVGLALRGVHA